MKTLCCMVLSVVFCAIASAQSTSLVSDRDELIGAWHLLSISESDTAGKSTQPTAIKGNLIYTRDGRMSVQLMYPPSAAPLSNDYVLNGYEASFGSYDVNEATHTVTHHVEGSITKGLVGKDLTRIYQLSDGHLIIKSANPQEHWRVVWERYDKTSAVSPQTRTEQGERKWKSSE